MLEIDRMLVEANRQFTICNACRYCEGYCAVFPAMERQETFAEADMAYLANLCHDCRACYQACMYAPPHEFAIDIPTLLTTARTAAFEAHARPRALATLFETPGRTAVFGLLLGFLVTLASFVAAASTGAVEMSPAGADFYKVLPYTAMLIPGLIVGVLALISVSWSFLTALGTGRDVSIRHVCWALSDAVLLRNMSGGGGDCYYPDADEPSGSRRLLHQFVAVGFLLAFAATVAAAFEQEILGNRPPYPVISVPVLLGLVGGLGMTIGCLGLLRLKRQTPDILTTPVARRGEYVELVALLIVSVTGIILLLLRSTGAVGYLLAIHLIAVYALFLAFPYSRLVHAAHRFAALLRNAGEAAAERRAA